MAVLQTTNCLPGTLQREQPTITPRVQQLLPFLVSCPQKHKHGTSGADVEERVLLSLFLWRLTLGSRRENRLFLPNDRALVERVPSQENHCRRGGGDAPKTIEAEKVISSASAYIHAGPTATKSSHLRPSTILGQFSVTACSYKSPHFICPPLAADIDVSTKSFNHCVPCCHTRT